ncbi:unnamed protein product [Mesocestoides corti]|uniref:NADH dehydrogenase [ubiquinone] 1 alpha subcomplex subunit 13 n=1 Tax=Mesocestoides corti TaxID=53468 RepID=A0A0R3U4T8_MESCO|nr:unnamed protein product [Mesocestoides corti]
MGGRHVGARAKWSVGLIGTAGHVAGVWCYLHSGLPNVDPKGSKQVLENDKSHFFQKIEKEMLQSSYPEE